MFLQDIHVQQDLSKRLALRLGCYSIRRGNMKKSTSKMGEEMVSVPMEARLGDRESATS